jgi:4-hydroxybenzoate polyprenyltransferase
MRPAEWMKNAFVLAPVVFAGRLDEVGAVAQAVAAAAAFCAVASAGYLLNDIRDIELDRQHPTKRRRPIAAGDLPVRSAQVQAVVLVVVGLGLAAAAGLGVLGLLAGYAALTTSYSMGLKNLVIIDVMAIAAGFMLRVFAGVVAVDAPSSKWLIITTGMLAMLLGFTKRRQEAVSELHDGVRSRPVLAHYSLPFLDQMVSVAAAGTLISYVINSVSSEYVGDRMLATSIPVVYGVLRYLYLIYHVRDHRGTASLIASDPGIVGAGVVWIAIAAAIQYS